MARRLYTLFFFLCLPLILLRLLYRAIKAPAYARRWAERFALGGDVRSGGIWVHAVSVGESIAAAPMVRELLKRYPALPITVTCMTPTGSEQIRKLFGGQVGHAYLPYDLPWLQRRLLRRLQPKIGIIMETELWPNLVAEAGRARVPLVLANARLSARSARGYQRVGALVRPMFAALDWVAVQSQAEALRFIELGVGREQMQVTGSIKFDFRPDPQQVQQAQELRARWGSDRPVWIAASTHAGEDEQVLRAHRQVLDTLPDALLILVPRHPERFDSVARQVSETGFGMVRRSSGALPAADQQVLVGDTMGELMMLYGAGDMAFVGGSLIERGGHNPLEPAAWGIPVLSGPHVFNFETVYERLRAGEGVVMVQSGDELGQAVVRLMATREERQALGERALAVVNKNRGALDRVVEGIVERL
ncbi:lipid IV(A) 3-deoxy-D-manno-octulosonic acid transferase [uncultured Marinobacter sp.]|uniref:lipid IV(A) 3-deoxy-D-manno-octulosonic acid transferase n=1 Tax=uncultured Marinobacter sp. TaxID=187379 RepID=UPI00258BD2BA|nr:lipid IV(A) 3-deoxy-D-manno-octulosonic acid transferase [uncultured Marinobacter sp.]